MYLEIHTHNGGDKYKHLIHFNKRYLEDDVRFIFEHQKFCGNQIVDKVVLRK